MHLVKEFKCLFSISLLNISWNVHSPWRQILCQHSVKHPVTICQTTILCIHSDKCSHQVDVWLKFSFYDAWVHLRALFQSCSWTSNCMEDTTASSPLVAWAQISRRPVYHTPAEHIQRLWWSLHARLLEFEGAHLQLGFVSSFQLPLPHWNHIGWLQNTKR